MLEEARGAGLRKHIRFADVQARKIVPSPDDTEVVAATHEAAGFPVPDEHAPMRSEPLGMLGAAPAGTPGPFAAVRYDMPVERVFRLTPEMVAAGDAEQFGPGSTDADELTRDFGRQLQQSMRETEEIVAGLDPDYIKSFREALPDATDEDVSHLEALFPPGEWPGLPLGDWVLVQDKLASETIGKTSIIRADTVKDSDSLRESIARVLAVGPMAGFDRVLGHDLPGWPWYELGDIVRVPKFSTNRYQAHAKAPVFRFLPFRECMARIINVGQVLN